MADSADQEFLNPLIERIDQVRKDIEEAEKHLRTLYENAKAAKPIGGTTEILMPDGKQAGQDELNEATRGLTAVEARLKEQAAKTLPEAPAGCAECSAKAETLKKDIDTALTEIAAAKQANTAALEVSRIRAEEIKKLEQQLQKAVDMDTEEEFLEDYRIRQRIYTESVTQWQALVVTETSRETLQKLIASEQKLIELNGSLAAAGLSSSTSVETDRSNQMFNAEDEEGKAVSKLFRSILKTFDDSRDRMSDIVEELDALA